MSGVLERQTKDEAVQGWRKKGNFDRSPPHFGDEELGLCISETLFVVP